MSTADDVLGKARAKRQPWVTNEVLNLCDQRRELTKKKYLNDQCLAEYREMNRTARKKMRETKAKWIDDQCLEIEGGLKVGNSKQVFKLSLIHISEPTRRS